MKILLWSSFCLLAAVSLPSNALRTEEGGSSRPIKWNAEGDFDVEIQPGQPIAFAGVTHGLKISHLGNSSIEFTVLTVPASETELAVIGGTFTITGANGDTLEGAFTGGALDLPSGIFYLLFDFTGGTGRFEGASGSGRTDGSVDLVENTYTAINRGTVSY